MAGQRLAGLATLRAACVMAALLLSGVSAWSAARAGPPPVPKFSDRDDGISCPFFDVALSARWLGGRPNWTDANGKPGGDKPFARERMEAGDTRRVRRLDVTALARAWLAGTLDNQGLLLRLSEGELTLLHARETADTALRPQLLLRGSNGKSQYLEPTADATLDCATFRGLGRAVTLMPRNDTWVAMRFEIEAWRPAAGVSLQSAELILVRTPDAPRKHLQLDVMALRSPLGVAGPPRVDGIASRYPADAGIEKDAGVLFADGFEARGLDSRWKQGMAAQSAMTDADDKLNFEPLVGRALRVTIPRGQQLGLDLRYRFRDHPAGEPEEVYFRYYLRLARDWLSAVDGGKLPGLAGTYGRAGWGGRPWDGKKGWSMRGSYGLTPATGHAVAGKVMLGSYIYHAKAESTYGEGIVWPQSGLAGLAEVDRWYCIEQRVKLNTPGREDGLLQVWVDGRLALALDGLRLRDLAEIRIEEVWMNVFHGGTQATPVALHAFIDAVVVARSYIGPLAGR